MLMVLIISSFVEEHRIIYDTMRMLNRESSGAIDCIYGNEIYGYEGEIEVI